MTDTTDPAPCPVPHKIFRVADRATAEMAARFKRPNGDTLEPYLCDCGLWHLRNLDRQIDYENRMVERQRERDAVEAEQRRMARAAKQRRWRHRRTTRQQAGAELAPILALAEHADWLEFS